MQELIRNAWGGWLQVTDAGKLICILLAVLIYYLFTNYEIKKQVLFIYTTVMTALCICPLSAALFMVYQTKFYDYQWIWVFVPVTMLIAWGGAVFFGRERRAFVVLGLLAALLLSGPMGNSAFKVESAEKPRQAAEQLLEEIYAQQPKEPVCLWAPMEIMEYARMVRGDIQLLYGRNMWDESLNAYSYDTYSEKKKDCYLWMSYAEEWGVLEGKVDTGEGKKLLQGDRCVRSAIEQGANVICLPKSLSGETAVKLEADLGMPLEKCGDYWILWIVQREN